MFAQRGMLRHAPSPCNDPYRRTGRGKSLLGRAFLTMTQPTSRSAPAVATRGAVLEPVLGMGALLGRTVVALPRD